MDFIRFFIGEDDKKRVRSLNALGTRVQGDVSSGITGLETRVEDLENVQPVTFGPVSLSGTSTSIITTIPSWARWLLLDWDSLSTNGTSSVIAQIGPSGGVATASYMGSGVRTGDAGNSNELHTNGFRICPDMTAASVHHGGLLLRIHNSSTNAWHCRGETGRSDSAATRYFSGSIALSGALTQITFTTVGGANTFDGGTVSGVYGY